MIYSKWLAYRIFMILEITILSLSDTKSVSNKFLYAS